jgi:hypothetical protein
MPYNGSGTFTLTYSWATESASPPIAISKLDTQEQDIATALSNCLTRDGQGKPSADIDWNAKKITNLADATAATHALNRQAADARYLPGGTLATDRLLGRDTAGSGAPEAISLDTTLEFTGSAGIRRAALTGDVTASAGSNATTIANNAVTFAKMADIATDRLVGRDTASTGDPEALTVGGGIEFTGSGGIQRSALTGDVTASAGSNTTTIAADAVENTMLANMTQATVKGRASGAGTGDPTDLTAAQLVAIITTADGAGSGLDADTLDGSSSAAFAAASHTHAGTDLTTSVSTETASFSPAAGDAETIIICNSASTITVTLNASTLSVGDSVGFIRRGAGAVTFAAGASQTINSPGSALNISTQHGKAVATYIATNTWELSGNLS